MLAGGKTWRRAALPPAQPRTQTGAPGDSRFRRGDRGASQLAAEGVGGLGRALIRPFPTWPVTLPPPPVSEFPGFCQGSRLWAVTQLLH